MNKNNKCRVFWDDKNNIGRSIVVGIVDESTAIWIREQANQIMENRANKTCWCVDLTQMKTAYDVKSRKNFVQLSHDDRIEKMAIITTSTITKTVVNFVMKAAGKSHRSKFFSIEDEALKWLKQGTSSF